MITITPKAAEKLKEILTEEDGTYLRASVQGGGCSGFQYGFIFDSAKQEGDLELREHGAVVLIDPASYQYLVGAEIGHEEGVAGAQFVIKNNPNASHTCGCGSSFTV